MEPNAKTMISLRVGREELAQIDKLARRAKLSRTDFLVRSALDGDPLAKRLQSIDRRLARLEDRS